MISVSHLTKCYGKFKAIDDLSFEIEEGHIYGFLGPNGAGKSTTMNIITGCLAATQGDVKINGLDIFEDAKEAKKLIGYLPEIPPLYPDMTVEEYLVFVSKAKGVKKGDLPAEIDKALKETDIEDVKDKLIKNLSKGYKQRVGIAQALLANPSVIILDEPTVGLDPVQIIEIRNLIKTLGEKHTVILSSHILSEVEAIADTVMILLYGKLTTFEIKNIDKSLEDVFLDLVKKEKKESEIDQSDALNEVLDKYRSEEQNEPKVDEEEIEKSLKEEIDVNNI